MDKKTLYEWAEDMPVGWYKAFGKQICDEIWDVLTKYNEQDEYTIIQVKEKFGELRWYDGNLGYPARDEVDDIIDKYEIISAITCVGCGNPATKLSTGWILPHCDRCANRLPKIKFIDMPKDYLERK